MLSAALPSPRVYWKIFYWLEACFRARQCCSRCLIESQVCHFVSWLPGSCDFLTSGCGAARHPEKWLGASVEEDTHSRDGRQPLQWHIHSATMAIHNHALQTPGLWQHPRPQPPRSQRYCQIDVPAICVAGSGERLPRMDTRVYTLPTFQGNAARVGPSREFHPPVGTFLSCAYWPGRAAASVFWLPVLSHRHRQIHPLNWGIPSLWHHRRSSR